ncbi:MAG: VWA domain-containing protein [Acidobacteria bacterium]|nr:VWA domain-containing protein [Acidobacteriota bacterium]
MKLVRLLLVLLPMAPAVTAQEPVFKFAVNVDLVELHVTVLDEKDRPVGGLKKEHFRVLENRVEQQISVFKHEDIPVSLGLVVDNSRSIEPRKARLDAAALSFVRKGNPEDETFIIHFDDTARLARDFTPNILDLEQTLNGVKPYGQTAIYDAMHLALDHMVNAKQTKRAILLITDGVDNVSEKTLEQTVEKVKRDKVAIYVVGLLSLSGGLKAEESLIRIAEASGGRAYFPENVEEARATMERIARDLREQYTLGYFPSNAVRDGAWRSVRVEITPPLGFPQKLNANYRHGYYGPDSR